MGRTVLVPAIVAVASRARHALLAASLAVMLALTLAAPVAAQEETTSGAQTTTRGNDTTGKQEEQAVQGSGQQDDNETQAEDRTQVEDERTADPLKGQTATITPNSIGPIAIAGCEAAGDEPASITVADESGEPGEDFIDNEGVVFQFEEQGITIDAEEDEEDLTARFDAASEEITGEVIRSDGIVCDDSGGQRASEANAAADDENTAKTDDLENLSCEELLVLFRGESGSGQQYEDSAVFADAEVRARVEVCLEEEIVEGTAADEDLPDTGGPSLLALAVLGVVSAAAGLSVTRGGRR